MTPDDGAPPAITAFRYEQQAASYAARAQRNVPGLAELHRLTHVLLAEHAPEHARVLVVGAGGGLELRALADAAPGWHFDGVDPSAPMLEAARQQLGAALTRVQLHHGTVAAAPTGPFDGATCLLTLHFLNPAERAATLHGIYQRLQPGAALVVAHHSFPRTAPAEARWLGHYAAAARQLGASPEQAAQQAATLARTLPIVAPADDVAQLQAAGFVEIDRVYTSLTLHGWVARRG